MALASLLRRTISTSSSPSSSNWIALVGGAQRRSWCSAAAAAAPHSLSLRKPPRFLSSSNFSSSAAATIPRPTSDANLVRVIDSEVKYALESDDHDRVEETPNGFPFEIIDKPGEHTVSLTRKYQDEVIKVEVHMTSLVTGNHEGSGDDDQEDSSKGGNPSIPLVVSVVKGNGQFLEFGVTAYADEIAIESLSVKDSNASQDDIPYEGPDFGSLDENLQRAFHKYLEIRGIKPITTNFLHEYMINKDSREYLVWLKNLKKFIEK
ncbi:hypothetical protein Sjap_001848 [Stephania japonica]|uniref:Mitochondrial glycoprotein n=1 Tax=Stephania japonica TaxID=461633 RepID=A0AAP0KMB0_9MAGN